MSSVALPIEPPHLSADAGAHYARDLLRRWASTIGEPDTIRNPYLNAGAALHALVLRHAALRLQREDFAIAAATHLERAFVLQDALPLSSSLYRGICGLGWVLARFDRPDLLPWRASTLVDIDALIADGLDVTDGVNIDVVDGVAGIAIYALARGNAEASAAALWGALDEKIGGYLHEWLQADAASLRGGGGNLGVAHGVPGLLAVAAAGAQRGLLGATTTMRLQDAFDTLWTFALHDGDRIFFPNAIGQTHPARLAWCYGSYGLAAAFHAVAALDPRHRERVQRLCDSAAIQFDSPTRVFNDASLCHGHAGAALSCAWLARENPLTAASVQRLQAQALTSAAAAFDAEQRSSNGPLFLHSTKSGLQPSSSLLEGGAGIALALDAAFASDRADWLDLLGYF
jgi:hypothetical protein